MASQYTRIKSKFLATAGRRLYSSPVTPAPHSGLTSISVSEPSHTLFPLFQVNLSLGFKSDLDVNHFSPGAFQDSQD